jgi:DNA-binding NarL/FixJ family response regulator
MTNRGDTSDLDPVDALTSREREIIELFALGLENKVPGSLSLRRR